MIPLPPPLTHTPLPQHTINQGEKITEFFCKNSSTCFLPSLLVSIYQSLFLYNKAHPSKHIEVFEREIQSHEMVKSLWESVVVP